MNRLPRTLVLLPLVVMSGCSPSPQAVDLTGPWAVEIAAAQGEVTTDLGRQIVADGVIDAAEFRELKQEQISCIVDLGYEAELLDEFVLRVGGFGGLPEPAGDDEEGVADLQARRNDAMTRCEGDLAAIESLYYAMTVNPQNEDMPTLIAACLVRHGVREPGYTAADYTEELEQQMSGGPIPEGFTSDEVTGCQIAPTE